MRQLIQSIVACFPRRPAAYFLPLIAWAVTLWFLSAGKHGPDGPPAIPHFDKFCHFSYFFIGGVLLTIGCWLKWPSIRKSYLFRMSLLMGAIIGATDEYHQSFTPGRSGNDLGDLIADTVGSAAGSAFIIFAILPTFAVIMKNKRVESNISHLN